MAAGSAWPGSLWLACGCKEACVADVAEAWLKPPLPRWADPRGLLGSTACKVAKRKSFPCSSRWPWSCGEFLVSVRSEWASGPWYREAGGAAG